ncbi:MAG: CbtA family protein [Dehalococcoidia bacterium]|nr:CbtA family protein [Dehalococcoidia bacterium]
MGSLVMRGMLAGVLAAVLAFCFATAFGEPAIEQAIAVEEASAASSHEHDESAGADAAEAAAPVSRGVQRTFGLAVGLGVLGVALGGVFAILFALARGRLGLGSDRVTALVVAVLAFTSAYLVPFLKYPANPPAVGHPETIEARTVAYVGMFVCSVLVMTAAVLLQRRLAAGSGAWNASLVAAAVFVLAMAVVGWGLPTFSEVPDAFPANTLWEFRIASMGTQLFLWLGTGLVFAALTGRPHAPSR